jgi:hypothetical protein
LVFLKILLLLEFQFLVMLYQKLQSYQDFTLREAVIQDLLTRMTLASIARSPNADSHLDKAFSPWKLSAKRTKHGKDLSDLPWLSFFKEDITATIFPRDCLDLINLGQRLTPNLVLKCL